MTNDQNPIFYNIFDQFITLTVFNFFKQKYFHHTLAESDTSAPG